MGATILGTGILASLSGSYAFYIVTNNIYMSVCFGFVWGAIIINLDRFITSSIKKTGDESKNLSFSEKFFCWFTEIGHAMPRFIIALIIGLVISKPIELRLFKSEIDENLFKNQQILLKQKEESIKKKYDSIIGSLKEELKKLDEKVEKSKNDFLDELNGNLNNSTGIRGFGGIAKQKKELFEGAKKEFNQLKKEVKKHETEYKTELIKNQKLIKENTGNGLLSKIKVLSNLTEENITVWWTNILIICLICLIEMAPVFVKIISDRGPYDALLDCINKEIMFRADRDTENMKFTN